MKTNVLSVIISLSLSATAYGTSWQEILKEKQHLFDKDSDLSIIKEQQAAFSLGQAPTIAHPVIKSIPIVENGQKLVDLNHVNYARITLLPNPSKPFESDACNSGLPSASQMRTDVYKRLVAMSGHLDDLAPEFGYKPHEVSIKLFEGLRDLKTQTTLFGNKKAEIMAARPELTEEQAETETAKWVSPVKNNVPVHSTGAAIDIRLWNETTRDFLDLGKFGVIWGSNPSAQTFCEDSSAEQKRNRLYLLMAASKAGLVNYVYEYWHLSAGDRYALYWQEKDATKRLALYDSVK